MSVHGGGLAGRLPSLLAAHWLALGPAAAQGMCPTATAAQVVFPLEAAEAAALQDPEGSRRRAARLAASEARVREARAALFPELQLGVDASLAPGSELVRIPIDLEDPNSDKVRVRGAREVGDRGAWEPFFRWGLSLELGGVLWDFGRTASIVDAADAHREAVVATLDAEQLGRLLRVRAAYLDWYVACREADFAAAAHAAARARLRRVTRAVAEGTRPVPERSAARMGEASARLEAERRRAEAAAAGRRLALRADVTLPAGAIPDPEVLRVDARPHDDDRTRLEVLIRLHAAATARADAFSREHRPYLRGDVRLAASGQMGIGFPGYRLRLGLVVPLWDAGAEAARAEAARAEAIDLGAQADAERARLAARHAERALARRALRAQVEVAAELLAHAEQHRHDVRAAYDAGTVGLDAVEAADRRLRDAQRTHLAAELELARLGLGLGDPD